LTSLTCKAWSNRRGAPLLGVPVAIAFGIALAIAPTLTLAEIEVRGTPDALSVEAQNASVEEILVALSNALDVEFRSTANLEKRLTGIYQG
jgi:predicted outer membrane lipoprotein